MIYDSTNIFARILRGEIPNKTVYDDEHVLAFHDVSPAAPIHVLVIPKGEYSSFDDFAATANALVIAQFFKKVQDIAVLVGADKTGYRLVTNHGADAAQSVAHFHIHILAGKPLGSLLAEGA